MRSAQTCSRLTQNLNIIITSMHLKFCFPLHRWTRTCFATEPEQSISYQTASSSCENLDQSAHMRRLISLFSVRLKTLWILGCTQSILRRFWSDHNPFTPEFLKWTIAYLKLDTPLVANRGFSIKSLIKLQTL